MVRHPVYTPLTTTDGPSYNGTLYFLLTLMDLGRSRERLWPPETCIEQTLKMPIKLGTLSRKTRCLHWNSNMQEDCRNRWLGKWILLQNCFGASLHNKLCTITCVMSDYILNPNDYCQTMIYQPSTHFLIWETSRGWCGLREAQVRTDNSYTYTAHNYQANQRKNKDLDNSDRSNKVFESQRPQSSVYRPLKWLR